MAGSRGAGGAPRVGVDAGCAKRCWEIQCIDPLSGLFPGGPVN